jgi:hypothetical protein
MHDIARREQISQMGELNGVENLIHWQPLAPRSSGKVICRLGRDDLLQPHLVSPNRNQRLSILEVQVIKKALAKPKLKLRQRRGCRGITA